MSMVGPTVVPPDGHVHTEWSWDADAGSMEESCVRALKLGLASIAFTEHADFTSWVIDPKDKAKMDPSEAAWVKPDGRLHPPPLAVDAYLECVQRCRERFPSLRILSGIELGEPHWHEGHVNSLLSIRSVDRVLGSVHSLAVEGRRMVDHLVGRVDPGELMRAYLAEVFKLVESSVNFIVLAHIDYPVRYWPAGAGGFEPGVFEEEYRDVLGALARTGRALELNTSVPLPGVIVRWWYEAGGEALTFGSDAHEPSTVATGFSHAAAVAEASGFRPGRYAHDFWRRTGSSCA